MVDEATADSLRAVDWGLNMHICDRVNKGQPDDIKDALRALSKRLRPAGVGVGTQMLALTLLEALVKHCGPELHLQVATREFLGDLKTLAEPGRADGRVSRKVLQLIHAWGEAFKDMRREMPLFYDTLLDLRAKGLSFPPFDASIAPNFLRSHTGDSPPATAGGRHADAAGGGRARESDGGARLVVEGRNTTVGGVGGGNLAMHGPRGVAVFDVELLKNDLEQVNAEVNLLVDMVTSADDDGNSGTAGMDTTAQMEARTLINELHRNVQIFQARVVALIEQVAPPTPPPFPFTHTLSFDTSIHTNINIRCPSQHKRLSSRYFCNPMRRSSAPSSFTPSGTTRKRSQPLPSRSPRAR